MDVNNVNDFIGIEGVIQLANGAAERIIFEYVRYFNIILRRTAHYFVMCCQL